MNNAQIICVDDTNTEAIILQQVLQDAGYEVDIASSGVEALEMIRSKKYDLAVVDQIMPDQTGLEMLNTLSTLDNKPAIIMLTAHNDPKVAHRAYDLGANHFIIKDNRKKYLSNIPAAVRQTITQKQILEELAREKQKVERINLNLMLLHSTSHLLTSTQDIDQITMRFAQTIASVLHTQGTIVWLYPSSSSSSSSSFSSSSSSSSSSPSSKIESESRSLVCSAAYSAGQHLLPSGANLPTVDGIAEWVATTGQSVMTDNVEANPRYSSQTSTLFNYETKSMLAVPLICQAKVVGVLQLINKQSEDFDETDETLAKTLAAYAANAIVNAQLVEQLRQQNEDLELQNADLDAYSDSVAHDLKNPITHFLCYADNLRESFSSMPADEIDEHLTTIVEQSRRMSDIIEELLLLARIRSNPEIEPGYLDMNEVVQSVIKRLKHDIDATQAKITLPDSWPISVGYEPWIEGVWYNYMSNGLRYGGTPPHLTIASKILADGTVRYQVSDNGNGLTSSEQDLLFKPFPKLQHSPKGNGLGLVIVRRVIERLNGTFGVESNPGCGSSFYFTLPGELS